MRITAAAVLILLAGCAEPLRINQLQFVGSHNSYKLAMSDEHMNALRARNPDAARSLEYAHVPLEEQLDRGLRKLELDVFFDKAANRFVVGHVQIIDMNSHCELLEDCLRTLRAWSDEHPTHVPIWISFNAKDQQIAGLPDPFPFDAEALDRLDRVLETSLGDRLIRPRDVEGLNWPEVAQARGKFLLVLDEGGTKRELYWRGWRDRPMFTNAPAGHQHRLLSRYQSVWHGLSGGAGAALQSARSAGRLQHQRIVPEGLFLTRRGARRSTS